MIKDTINSVKPIPLRCIRIHTHKGRVSVMQPQRGAFKASWALSPLFTALCIPPQLHQAALLQKAGTERRAALPSAGLTGRAGGQPCEPEAGWQPPVIALAWLGSAPATQSGQRAGSVSHTEPTDSPSPNGSARQVLPYITRPLQTGSKVERLALPACLLTDTTPGVLQQLPVFGRPSVCPSSALLSSSPRMQSPWEQRSQICKHGFNSFTSKLWNAVSEIIFKRSHKWISTHILNIFCTAAELHTLCLMTSAPTSGNSPVSKFCAVT